MKQRGVTIFRNVLQGHERALKDHLRSIGNGVQDGSNQAFSGIEQLHSLSFFVIDPVEKDTPAILVLEANIDGSIREFLKQLVNEENDLLIEFYSHCEGCDASQGLLEYLQHPACENNLYYVGAPGQTTERTMFEALIANSVLTRVRQLGRPQARRSMYLREIWAALPDGMREHIRQRQPDRAMRSGTELSNIAKWLFSIWWRFVLYAGCGVFALILLQWWGVKFDEALTVPRDTLATIYPWAMWLGIAAAVIIGGSIILDIALLPKRTTAAFAFSCGAGNVRRKLWATVRALLAFAAASGILAFYVWHGAIALWALAICFGVPLLLVLLYALLSILHTCYERNETFQDLVWDPEREAPMRDREDRGPQNHFAGVTTIKDTPLRVFTVWFVLCALRILIPITYPTGGLSGIKSIHFARWTLLPKQEGTKQRRLLFVGHYDGSWGGYLGDFVTLMSRGVTAIWGNTRGCPRHTFLFNDGVLDEQRFKCYARASQVESLLWYTRNRTLTVRAIQRNARICDLLAQALPGSAPPITEERVDAFMRLF